MKKGLTAIIPCLLVLGFFPAGCSPEFLSSYPSDKLKQSVVDICRKEYGVQNVDVKIVGETIGVYLPLERLFAADFRESVLTGKVRNLDTLFEPSPEAMDKVLDVLFTISRVLLSTDSKIKFYTLEATDENTGLQLIFKGFVDDVKRVRIWDISRDEYRRRVIHEMRQNSAVLWHKPVRNFFRDLGGVNPAEILDQYFSAGYHSENDLRDYFYISPASESGVASPLRWEILDIRSARVQGGEVLIYVSARPMADGEPYFGPEKKLQYLFMLSFLGEKPRILRVIPFQYTNDWGELQDVPFPPDLRLEESLDAWEMEFPVENVTMGSFLAAQLSRRIQYQIGTDERILNTFQHVKMKVLYYDQPEEPRHFALVFDALIPRDFQSQNTREQSLAAHEDVQYVLGIAARHMADVIRSYNFTDFEYLSYEIPRETVPILIGREDLELFRRKKVDFQSLLANPPGRVLN